jgi:hypothetical protein
MAWLRSLETIPGVQRHGLNGTARLAQVKTVYSLKVDKIKVYDQYEVSPEW